MDSEDIILEKDEFLGSRPGFVFAKGIYHKMETGIGATTAELDAKRHSILIFPSRSIAWTKSLTSGDYFYVGSQPNKVVVTKDSIAAYHSSPLPTYKKILVVANSLPKVFEAIGTDNCYEKYFLFFDEIDKFQSESVFRSELEDCIDYYLDPKCNGCLITATLQEFSNPALAGIPVKRILTKDQKAKPLFIEYLASISEIGIRLNEVMADFPEMKFVIAYKSLTRIRSIIEKLNYVNRKEIGILSGKDSKEDLGTLAVDFEKNGILPRRVVFMTAAFFSGIDIVDQFYLLIISDKSTNFTLLTRDEIIQIYGRARQKMFAAKLFIEKRNHEFDPVSKKVFIKAATKIKIPSAEFLKSMREIGQIDQESLEGLIQAITGIKRYQVQLLRIDRSGNPTESYFTIDQYVNRMGQLHAMYSKCDNLKLMLGKHFQITEVQKRKSYPDNSDHLAVKYIDQLNNSFVLPDPGNKIERLIHNRASITSQYFSGREEFQLFLKRTYSLSESKFAIEYNRLIFQNLPEVNPFRVAMMEGIKEGSRYSVLQMKAIVEKAFERYTPPGASKKIRAIIIVSFFFEISKRIHDKGKDGGNRNGWKIIGVVKRQENSH